MYKISNDQQYDYYRRFVKAAAVEPDDWCFVCAYGLGDTYFVCSLAMAFRQSGRLQPGEKLTVAVKKSQAHIPDLFPGFINRVITFEKLDVEALTRFGRFQAGSPHICHPFHYGDGRVIHFLTKDGVTLLDMYRFLLDVPFDSQPVPPMVPAEARLSARRKLEAWALPRQRTAILAPHAFSMHTLPELFWERLAARLKDAGWTVVLNHDPATPLNLPGVPSIDYSLLEAIPVVGHCGWLISSRSGLCDLVSSAPARQTVLYPRMSAAMGTRFNEMHAYSLRDMGLCPDAVEMEVLIDADWTPVIERILASAPDRGAA